MIKIKIALIAFLLLSVHNVFSQTTLSGIVSDESGTPLPGTSVIVKGTTNGTQTDFDGKYTLPNVDSDATITVSYIGFVTQNIPVNGKSTLNVTLAEDLQALEEVIVVGYGTQSRAEVSGAISTISAKELTAIPVANAAQALQGRASGVTVINNGSPGTAPEVRIRGLGTMNNSSPLYVIDGVISSNGLANLNPNDIESMNILKDASTTAIYGSLGSNGVVMVTTKKGSKSGKTTLTFDSYTGINYVTNRYDVLNTQQYLQYAQDAFGVTPASTLASSGLNTNWQDEIFTTGVIKNYNLGVSGGTENSTYLFSIGHTDQEGAIIETGFKQYSVRANSTFDVGRFTFGENLSVAFNSQTPEAGLNSGRSLIEHAIKMAPYLPVYNANNLGGFQGPSSALDGQDAANPVRMSKLRNALNKYIAVNGSIYGQYEIIDGLKFKSQLGLDYRNFTNNIFVPSFNDDSENTGTGAQAYADITKNSGQDSNVIFTNSLNYVKTINDVHNFEVLLLTDRQDGIFTSTNTNSRNELTDGVQELTNTNSVISSRTDKYTRVSYLGRLNYNFDQKYIFAASIRKDASSRFGQNNRWGYFPSVALGYNIAKESFLENTDFSTFKLRGSWGVVGNDKLENYAYTTSLSSNFNYPFGGTNYVGVTAEGVPNPDLKWEETTMINIGLDVGLFNEKVTMAVEYYDNTSDDLLMQLNLSDSFGYLKNYIWSNVGSVQTKGIELSLGYRDSEGDFTWSANANIGTSKNEALSLGGLEEIVGGTFENENLSRIAVGEKLFHFYGLKTDGIYQTQAEVDAAFSGNPDQTAVQPGDVKYVDISGDGNITSADRTIIGDAFPDFTYGLNFSGNYKNWDFNVFINGVSGNDIYNTNTYDLEGMPRLFNSGTAVLNRWTGEGTSNTIPRAFGATQNVSASDRFIEDGSYTRLKNMSIGYSVPTDNISKYMTKLRLYVSGQNLITLTNYSGLDPEVGNPAGGSNFEIGIDRGNYPQPKSLLLGVQVAF